MNPTKTFDDVFKLVCEYVTNEERLDFIKELINLQNFNIRVNTVNQVNLILIILLK